MLVGTIFTFVVVLMSFTVLVVSNTFTASIMSLILHVQVLTSAHAPRVQLSVYHVNARGLGHA